jgi:transcriptional regulator with GAF, ATPase, and Fis domain
MTSHVTIPRIRSRHRREEGRLILAALERNGWNVGATARELGVPDTGLRAMIESHGLGDEVAKHGRGAGRPRKQGDPK